MASAIAILLLLSVAALYPVYRGLVRGGGFRFG